LKRFGNSPNRLFKNSSAEIGLPSALQNEVEIIDCISRSFPSFNFTFIFCRLLQLQFSSPQISQGSFGFFSQTQGVCPQTLQGCGGGFGPV
jgi:hypothetical protein